MSKHDIIVIGGGMVGSAIAWGLVRLGMKVTVLDGADESERSARANFGLIWGQSKGDGMREYAQWTHEAIRLWPEFQDELFHETGVSCEFSANGGLHLCMTEKELADRSALFDRMSTMEIGKKLDLKILNRVELADIIPEIGPEVVGAGYCGQDGHVSPHGLLLAMHRAINARGGSILSNRQVDHIEYDKGIWRLTSGNEHFETPNLVLAAGNNNKALGKMLGLDIPVSALKGQILVTERMRPRLSLPTHKVRQTEAGTILIGDSKEPEAGSDDRSTAATIQEIAERGIKMFPYLADVNLIRAWAGIRTMTQDGFPIYDQYADYPGLFSANCHSGVTLAPIHAMRLAPIIAKAQITEQVSAMSSRRFHVQAN